MDNKLYEFIATAPRVIASVANAMHTQDEKLMSIYGSTAIASALIPYVSLNYHNKKNFTQIYVAAVKPPGAGKGKLSLLARCVIKINSELIETNKILSKKYYTDLKIYESKMKKPDCGDLVPPEKPKLKLLLLSGNTTSSMLIQQFDDNDGAMALMIFETEIDGLTNMMSNKKFGGDNSTVFRKSYHNEPITQMRKGNLESLSANEPKLSIFITGTPSQLSGLFKSNDDGLFSRFTFFTSYSEDAWIDVKPCEGCHPLDETFDKIGEVYYALYHHMKNKKVEVKFTDAQWDLLNNLGVNWHKDANEAGGENATSIAKRHVNMIARCAANYTALRAFEDKNEAEIIYCNDQDFVNAQWLIELSFFKALDIFKTLPGEHESNSILEDLMNLLPVSFKRNELAPLEKSMKISDRNMDRHLVTLVHKKKIKRIKKGFYEKVIVAEVANGASAN